MCPAWVNPLLLPRPPIPGRAQRVGSCPRWVFRLSPCWPASLLSRPPIPGELSSWGRVLGVEPDSSALRLPGKVDVHGPLEVAVVRRAVRGLQKQKENKWVDLFIHGISIANTAPLRLL